MMLKRLARFTAVVFLIVSPALADLITDVTVNGSVSGTGNMTLRCFFQGSPPPGCAQALPLVYIQDVSTSFSATNTQVGDFSDSSQATGIGPTELDIIASQSTTATADSLSVDLYTAFSIFMRAPIHYYDVSLQNSIAVGFELTTESLLQVSGYLGLGDTQLFDSNGNPLFTGPCCNSSLILGPGMYKFTQSLPMTADGGFPVFDHEGTYFVSELDANFTPIPEPRWTGLTALIALGCLAYCRQRIAG
jgi:hypothetical protein